MIKIERFSVPAAPLPADNNIRHQYPIHKGKWVRHPDTNSLGRCFCRFTLDFTLDAPATIEVHVSADSRFEMACDGQYVGMGPDRSDIEHWSFHSYRLTLEKGPHRFDVEMQFLGLNPTGRPWAQTCIEPGFVLYAVNSPVDLNTGSAPWKVTLLNGVGSEAAKVRGFFVAGPDYIIDGKDYFTPPPAVDAVVLRDAGRHNHSGTALPGWKLYPSRLPEQLRRPVGGGRVRCVMNIADEAAIPGEDATPNPQWQAFVEGRAPITVAAKSRVVVLWDLDQYHTAYPELVTTGGAGAKVKVEWAESCTVNGDYLAAKGSRHNKGNRNEVVGKYFFGNGDTFLPDGPKRTFRQFWWRAGRYVRITVVTADQPVTLERLTLLESRMPIENRGRLTTSDPDLDPVVNISARGIQMCAHETYMDCPYYEQMMYTGDTRIQMLTAYVMSAEDRLTQRGIEIFDWSRHENGFVLERCPSQPTQLSCTFSMVWVLMLRDFSFWRNDPAFIKERLKGMRCLIEEFKALPDKYSPMLPALPGWSFMDWADYMSFVNNPGPEETLTSVTNLLFVNMLLAAAEVEDIHGEAHLAAYNRDWAGRISRAVEARFWDESRGLFADDLEHRKFSEHTQCLALLSGLYPKREKRCFESLITDANLLRCTVYFQFYLLETLQKFGRGDLLLGKLDFWKQMNAIGMKTPLEMPEPSRSDCHAWSSHPLFHLHASVAGIRPDAPGFAKVRIAPQPGSLTEINSVLPHPRGTVCLSMKRTDGSWRADVELPAGVEGEFHWKGKSHWVKGAISLTLPA